MQRLKAFFKIGGKKQQEEKQFFFKILENLFLGDSFLYYQEYSAFLDLLQKKHSLCVALD